MSKTHFFNPYNFVSTPVRNTDHEVLGDHTPLGHSRLVGGTYSGSLVIRMTAQTPLIIPSSDVKTSNGHKTKKTRVDQESSALIASSSVKGMIRSSYEMITNSRYGVFVDQKIRVRIGRELNDESPASVLDDSLRPATDFSSFSPAERLFGWVTDGKSSDKKSSDKKSSDEKNQPAYAGHVRFSSVKSLTDNAVESLNNGKILAILNSPKPSMVRFYAGVQEEEDVQPFQIGLPKKSALYRKGTTLRGRKVYPHHGGFDPSSKAWQSSTETKTNQTILDWIRPKSEFEFSIHFRNVTAMELGALLASIETGEGECHRLGGARPLGFGAVSMSIDYGRSRVSSQEMQATSWKNCEPPKIVDADGLQTMKEKFEEKVGATSSFKSFKAYIKGYANSEGITVTYPRPDFNSTDPRQILEWFIENERSDRGNLVHGYPLPTLGSSTENALPFLRRPPRNAQQN